MVLDVELAMKDTTAEDVADEATDTLLNAVIVPAKAALEVVLDESKTLAEVLLDGALLDDTDVDEICTAEEDVLGDRTVAEEPLLLDVENELEGVAVWDTTPAGADEEVAEDEIAAEYDVAAEDEVAAEDGVVTRDETSAEDDDIADDEEIAADEDSAEADDGNSADDEVSAEVVVATKLEVAAELGADDKDEVNEVDGKVDVNVGTAEEDNNVLRLDDVVVGVDNTAVEAAAELEVVARLEAGAELDAEDRPDEDAELLDVTELVRIELLDNVAIAAGDETKGITEEDEMTVGEDAVDEASAGEDLIDEVVTDEGAVDTDVELAVWPGA